MHPYLPIWMRGTFELRLQDSAAAIVRRDFGPAFDRLGLLHAGGPEPREREGAPHESPAAENAPHESPAPESAPGPRPAGRGAVRIVAAGPLGEAVVRPCRRGGLPGRFLRRRYLLGNRAFDELVVTEELRWRGVPVAEPLAAVQRRRRPGYVALLVTRRLPGALPLSLLLAGRPHAAASPDARRSPEARRAPDARPSPDRLMRAGGRAVRLLHRAGGWHTDLNAGNLVADPSDPELRVTLLDLDRGRVFPPPLPAPLARRSLRRLRRSLARLGLEEALAAWTAFEEGYARP